MIQRLAALILLLFITASGAQAAVPRKQPVAVSPSLAQPAPKPAKSPEQLFLDGRACLQRNDVPCVQATIAAIGLSSPYARILEAQIADAGGDTGSALRLLIPLQSESGLLPQAYASLHLTLAQAYAGKDDRLRAVEQYVLAGPFLDNPAESAASQAKLWELLAGQPRETLVEMRGESPDTVVQGWIDLALAGFYADQPSSAVEQWRKAYPDHPVGDALLRGIIAASAPQANTAAVCGKVALLLPLDAPDYAVAAQAVRAGFMAAHALVGYKVDIEAYPTDGTAETARLVYRQAVQDGAQWVVGALVRDELEAIASGDMVMIPTLSLNQPEGDAKLPEKLLTFGLPVENDARQVAQAARAAGMQSALILVAEIPSAMRMAKAFAQEWQAQGGQAPRELMLPTDDQLAEFKASLPAQLTDMIFLAADSREARRVRPFLDPSVPTYGISHIYDGDAIGSQNQVLVAVHFVDMPWLLNPDNSEFAPYRANAAEFGKGWPQRWFALGADAYQLLPFLGNRPTPGKFLLHGLSGDITLDGNGRLTRRLAPGQFRPDGVEPESRPQ
jgi:outer membrane PBP1 activator LpoA protein